MTPFTAQRRLFTPRKSRTTDERYRMHLSPEDAAKIGRGRWNAEVTDLNTGRRYSVQGADCGADCFCDAVVTYEHSLPDRAHVEVVAGKVRLIIVEEETEYGGWTVKDIVEWDSGSSISIARAMIRHCQERCGGEYHIQMPDDLVLDPRITAAATKFRRIIEHKREA